MAIKLVEKKTLQVSIYLLILLLQLIIFCISVSLFRRLGEELAEFNEVNYIIFGFVLSSLAVAYSTLGAYFAWINDYKAKIIHSIISPIIVLGYLVNGTTFIVTQIGNTEDSVNFILAAFSICCAFEVDANQLLFCNDTIDLEESRFTPEFPCVQSDKINQFENFKSFFTETEERFCIDIQNELVDSDCDPFEKNNFVDDVALIFLQYWYTLGSLYIVSLMLQVFVVFNFIFEINMNQESENESETTKSITDSKEEEEKSDSYDRSLLFKR